LFAELSQARDSSNGSLGTRRGSRPGMTKLEANPIGRALVWGALSVFSLQSGIKLAAGPGRDSTYDTLTWTGGAIAQVLVLTALLAAAFGYAAYVTVRHEVIKPTDGTLRLTGARLNIFGDTFMAVIGGLCLLGFAYMVLRVPECILASNHPTYERYFSASVKSQLMISSIFGVCGFLLMTVRRYIWEARPGQPLRRYWARPFSRGRVIEKPLHIYWTVFYAKSGIELIPVGRWLRAADPTSAGSFRDADLALVDIDTPAAQLAQIEGAWRAKFGAITYVAPAEPVTPPAFAPQY
jgi:hypothetical protein